MEKDLIRSDKAKREFTNSQIRKATVENIVICKNCNRQAKGNFCSNCGQSVKTGRINLHYIIHEIQHSIFHVDKGILFTIKELFLRPGKTIEEYIAGKRVNYFKPFGFVLILATIYGFISYYFKVYPDSLYWDVVEGTTVAKINSFDWVHSHYVLFSFFSYPFLAFSSHAFFWRKGYNFIEHLVSYSYITGMTILFQIILLPIYFMYSLSIYYIFTAILTFIYTGWVMVQIFGNGEKSLSRTIGKVVCSLILGIALPSIITGCCFLCIILARECILTFEIR